MANMSNKRIVAKVSRIVYLCSIMTNAIWIGGNMPSSKNSKQWTGSFLVSSKTTQKYIKDTKEVYIDNRQRFWNMIKDKQAPYYVAFKFIRGSKHLFDYVNPCQTVLDLMVKYGWIDDDNCNIIIPVFIPYEYSKEKPGVFIKVIEPVN